MKIKLGSSLSNAVLAGLGAVLDNHRDDLLNLIDSPLGIELDIKRISARQTSPQRGYYWRSLKFWGSEQGYSAKESEEWLHNAVCCEAFGVLKRQQLRNNCVVEVPNMTSARLSIEDYSVLIDTMLRLAAEDGVAIPEPEER